MSIAVGLAKRQTWPNQTPEVDLRRYGRHLVKSIRRHNSVGDHPICTKFGRRVQNHMPMTVKSSSKPGVEFKLADVCFQQPEIVITWPWIEISGRNLMSK